MNSPHASCVDKGHRAIAKTNAVRVAGPGRICFLETGRWCLVRRSLAVTGFEDDLPWF